MLVQGHEVRRRWKSPMPSRSASERWARERALGFLADQVRPKQEEKPQEPEKKAIPTLAEFAKRWTEQYVVARWSSLRSPKSGMRCALIATTERYLHTDSDNPDQAMLRVARGPFHSWPTLRRSSVFLLSLTRDGICPRQSLGRAIRPGAQPAA